MGQSATRVATPQKQSKMNSVRNYLPLPEVTEEEHVNGLTLKQVVIPEEILIYILQFVDNRSLLKCRLVCRKWRQLVEREVWKEKYPAIHKILKGQKLELPWVHMYMLLEGSFNKNLVKNCDGRMNYMHWGNDHNGWAIEKSPTGADPVPEELQADGVKGCFATTFHLCTKEQMIDLAACGISGEIMDALQPAIEVSEWYAGRFDCGCWYHLSVELLGEEKVVIQEYEEVRTIEQWLGRQWNKVSHTFREYGPGVRYVRFCHEGKDTQFWAGHYGSKMTGACVKVLLEPTAVKDNKQL